MCWVKTLRFEWFDTLEELTASRSAWDACVNHNQADIYFSADWLELWFKHIATDCELRACCLWLGEEMVGVLPFYIRVIKPFGVPVRLAGLAAADLNYPFLKLPVPGEQLEAIVRESFSKLTESNHCHGIGFGHISDAAPEARIFQSILHAKPFRLAVTDQARQHTLMTLPPDWEGYWQGLSSSRRKEHRRSRNKLVRIYERLHHNIPKPAVVSEAFNRFTDQHRQQWTAAGKGGHFSDWPDYKDFYAALIQKFSKRGTVMIEEFWGNHTLLSSRLTFLSHGRAYWRLTSRSLDKAAQKTGAGRVAQVERIERLIENGIQQVEAGAGEYEYKLSYGGELIPIHRFVVSTHGWQGRARLSLLLLWANALDLFYYRIWFKKLAPRWRKLTGAKPKPLWKSWIRTRF